MSLPSRKGWVYDAHASSRASQSWVWEPFEPLGLVWLPSALGAGRVGRPAPLPMGFPLRSYLLRYDHCSNAVVCYVCLHTPFSGTCPDGGRWGWWWAASDVGEAQAFETAGRFWTASQSGELFRPLGNSSHFCCLRPGLRAVVVLGDGHPSCSACGPEPTSLPLPRVAIECKLDAT